MAATAGGIRAGKAYVELGVQDKLTRGLKAAEAKVREFGQNVQAVGKAMAAIGAAVAGPMLAATMRFTAVGDQLDKMSRRTGVSVEALSELGYAAQISGTDIETIEKSLRKMQKTIVDAARGSTTAVDTLSTLGITLAELGSLSPEDQFTLIADRLAGIADPTARAAIAMELFGKSGTAILPMIEGGAEGIATLRDRAREMGFTMSTAAATLAATLNDTLYELRTAADYAAMAVGEALAPTINAVATAMTNAIVRVKKWIEQHRELVATTFNVASVVAGLGVAVLGLGTGIVIASKAAGPLIAAIKAAGAVMGVVKIALVAAMSPALLLTAAVVGLGTALVVWSGAGAKAIAWLGDTFGWLGTVARVTFGAISDAINAGDIAAAAGVLWAGLKLAWLKGIDAIREPWEDFRLGFESIAINAFFAVRKAWANFTNWWWVNFPNFTAGVVTGWADMVKVMENVTDTFSQWVTDRFHEIAGLIDETYDVEGAKAVGRQELAMSKAASQAKRDAAVAEANRKRGLTAAEHEAELAGELADLERERQDALAGRVDAQAKRIADAAAELERAQADFEEARQRATGTPGTGTPGTAAPHAQTAGEEADGLAAVMQQRTSVAGTFNAAAIRGLGSRRDTEQIAKNTKTAAEETRKFRQWAEANRAAFA